MYVANENLLQDMLCVTLTCSNPREPTGRRMFNKHRGKQSTALHAVTQY